LFPSRHTGVRIRSFEQGTSTNVCLNFGPLPAGDFVRAVTINGHTVSAPICDILVGVCFGATATANLGEWLNQPFRIIDGIPNAEGRVRLALGIESRDYVLPINYVVTSPLPHLLVVIHNVDTVTCRGHAAIDICRLVEGQSLAGGQ